MKRTPSPIGRLERPVLFRIVTSWLRSAEYGLVLASMSFVAILVFPGETLASNWGRHSLMAFPNKAASFGISGLLLLVGAMFAMQRKKRSGEVARDLRGGYELMSNGLKAFFDSSPMSMLVYDASTSAFLDANAAATRQYGYSREEFRRMTLEDIQVKETISANGGGDAPAPETVTGQTLKHRKKDGTFLELEACAQAIVHNGQNATLLTTHDVTRWQHALEVRDRELHLHRTLLNRIPARIYAKDTTGRFVFANMAAAASRRQRQPEDLRGKTDFAYYAHNVASRLRTTEQEVIHTSKAIIDLESSEVDERGEQNWSSNTLVPWLDPNGNTVGILGIEYDITERKRAEDQMRLVQFMIEQAGEGVFWVEPGMKFGYVNKAACEMLGYTREELLDMHLSQVDEAFTFEIWPQVWEELKRGQSIITTSHHRSKQGRSVPVEVSANYLMFEGHEYSCAFVRDITQREQTQAALAASERRFSNAFNASPVPMNITTSIDGRIIDVNESFTRLVGHTREEILGRTSADLNTWVDPRQRERAVQTLRDHGAVREMEVLMRTKSGGIRSVVISIEAIELDGVPCLLMATTADITERKRVEAALEKSLAELESIVVAVSEGDLTQRAAEDATVLGRIARSVNTMLANFSKMVVRVKGLGLTVSSSAAQILAAGEEMAAGSERQAEEIASTSSSVEEMAASMTQVSRNAETTTAAAQRALVIAKRGDIAVNNSLNAMERIIESVQATSQKMHTLAERSSEISELLATIDGISSQANLLSLNAAIQAAHAGESGLGFSVVADEMRKLAERSVKSTKDINGLNRAIQAQTKEALSAMDIAMREVREGSQLAKVAGQSIQDISIVVSESASLIEEISVAAEDQARVSHRIAGAMQTVSGIAAGTSTGTHETAQIMHNMVRIADSLSEAILKFNTGPDDWNVSTM